MEEAPDRRRDRQRIAEQRQLEQAAVAADMRDAIRNAIERGTKR